MTRTKTKTSSSLFQAKSFPINKPPFFARSDYQFWKKKITWYLQSLDLEVWKTILFGYTFPPKVVDGNKIQKPLKEYDEEENNEFQLNSRAIYILLCAIELSIIEFVNAKQLRMFGGYSKLPMKEPTKSKILKLEFLLMIMKC